MRRIFSIAVLLLISLCLCAQTQDNITLVVSGQGSTKEDATANALRSAIEQAYGVFVSANTQILNDEVVKDEIATVASGNVKSYEELSCVTMADGSMSVTLSATVSISNLITYAKSHGSSAEFAGQTFAMNVKMRKLNTINESKALANLCDQVFELARDIYDYKVEVDGEPKVCDNGYEVKVVVTSEGNDNYRELGKLIRSTLQALSLSENEYEAWLENNMEPSLVIWDGILYRLRNNKLVLNSIFFELIRYYVAADASWDLKINPNNIYFTIGDFKFTDNSFYRRGLYFRDNEYNELYCPMICNFEFVPEQYFGILRKSEGKMTNFPICESISPQDVGIYTPYNVVSEFKDAICCLPQSKRRYEVRVYLSEQELSTLTGFEVEDNTYYYDILAKHGGIGMFEKSFKLGWHSWRKTEEYISFLQEKNYNERENFETMIEQDMDKTIYNLGVWIINNDGIAELYCNGGSLKFTTDGFLFGKRKITVNLISVDGTYCYINGNGRSYGWGKDSLMRGKVMFNLYVNFNNVL